MSSTHHHDYQHQFYYSLKLNKYLDFFFLENRRIKNIIFLSSSLSFSIHWKMAFHLAMGWKTRNVNEFQLYFSSFWSSCMACVERRRNNTITDNKKVWFSLWPQKERKRKVQLTYFWEHPIHRDATQCGAKRVIVCVAMLIRVFEPSPLCQNVAND